MDNYLSELNSEQLSAVTNVDGPLLLVAGAGTGKTRTIVSRIAHIIKNGFADPSEMLAVTFTNKAANEMVSRVLKLTGSKLPWLGTFHSIASKILRRHAEIVGLNSQFTIIDVNDQLKIIKDIKKELQKESTSVKPNTILNIIQKWKEKCLSPSEVNTKEIVEKIALDVYHQYQVRLKLLKCVDFGDLLFYNIQLFKQEPDILCYYQKKFKYIMVDEYQDTNAVQYLWLRYLSKEHLNICCVGDDDQSIYSWRGAKIENILKFSDDFKGAKTIKLECNYRSTSHILSAAWHVIKCNKNRLEKKLWTTNIQGEKVELIELYNEKNEADFISEKILTLNKLKYRYSDIAVLVRSVYQTRALEESFMQYSIPYKILCGMKFYERQEIRDIIAYLRLITNNDDDLAFERIVNQPKRNIGLKTIQIINNFACENKISFYSASQLLIKNKQITGKAKSSLNDFSTKIKAWQELLAVKPLSEFLETLVNESGYIEMLQKEETGQARIENIHELISSLKNFDDPTTFLEHISLVTDVDNITNANSIYVMTLHAAKGLEFPCVFLPGWEDGVFPHQRSFSDISGKSLEEERRLAYVGITRAKEKVVISHARLRSTYYNSSFEWDASRFIQELPREHIQCIKRSVEY